VQSAVLVAAAQKLRAAEEAAEGGDEEGGEDAGDAEQKETEGDRLCNATVGELALLPGWEVGHALLAGRRVKHQVCPLTRRQRARMCLIHLRFDAEAGLHNGPESRTEASATKSAL
jgi:hypothetical protein